MSKKKSCACHGENNKVGARSRSLVDKAIDFLPQGLFALGGAGTSLVVDGVLPLIIPQSVGNPQIQNLVRVAKGIAGVVVSVSSRDKNWKAYGMGMFLEAGSTLVRSVVNQITSAISSSTNNTLASNSLNLSDTQINNLRSGAGTTTRSTVTQPATSSGDFFF